jgi:hypothetical protein
MKSKIKILCCILLFASFNLSAYIGPGAGGGILAAFIGFILAIILLFAGIIYYPLKRFLKKIKDNKK